MNLEVSEQTSKHDHSLRRKVPLLGGLVNAANQDIGRERGDNGDDAQPDGRAPLVHGRGLLLVLLGLEKVGVSAELENEVGQVGQEEQDGSAARQSEQARERGVVGRRRFASSRKPAASLVREMVCNQLGGNAYYSQAAGMMRVMQDRLMSDTLVCAAVTWKVDSWK